MYAHVGFDPHAYLGLRRGPRYALVDATYANSWFTRSYLPDLQSGVREGRYKLLWSDDGVQLYDRGGTGTTRAEAGRRERGRRSVVARSRARSGSALDRGRRSE
jgi:hypothetical protein